MMQGLVNSLHAGLPTTPTLAPQRGQQPEQQPNEEDEQTMETVEIPQPEMELEQSTDKRGSPTAKRVAGDSPEQSKKERKRGKGKRS